MGRHVSENESEEWVTAAESLKILEPILGYYSAAVRICERAFAGIIHARAEHFQTKNGVQQNVNIPKEFWWAKGQQALVQDWAAGDFSTWIDNSTHELKAFGVTFAKNDIERVLGPSRSSATIGAMPHLVPKVAPIANNRIFLVHGHDLGMRDSVALFLRGLGLEPIVLDEQANKGRTIIEKLESHSDVGFAVVLMTPDDEGISRRDKEANSKLKPKARARQNVVLEMGYFMAHLTRARVCGLTKGSIEIPSDLSGVLVVPIDQGDWKNRLAKELEDAGYTIDWRGAGVVRTA